MKKLAFIGIMTALLTSHPSMAKAIDCPLRDEPFSIDSPLIDVLLSPDAREIANKVSAGRLAKIPERFAGTTPPTFAAILSLKMAGMFTAIPEDKLAELDKELRVLPVTDADRTARCARYDDEKPAFSVPSGKPRVLLFEKINGFRDGPSVEAAHNAFAAMAERNGWAIVSTDKGGAISKRTLEKFDVIIWNNISGDVLTLTQRKALRDFLVRGGGFVAVHGSGGDPSYFWDWYADELIGARFKGHPMNPQFQDARIKVNGAHPLARSLPTEWIMKDEWYSFSTNPRQTGANVLLSLDEASYQPNGMQGDLSMGDHPIAWTKCEGNGRTFYSAIGHMPETYSEHHYVILLENAIRWAGNRQIACSK